MNEIKNPVKSGVIEDQVPLFKLIFTANWEDPLSDNTALKIKPGEVMMTITSGACNTLSFLVSDPADIYAVDINPCQSYLMELKIAAIRMLDRNDCLRFFGMLPGTDRMNTYRDMRKFLLDDARAFWDQQTRLIEMGFMLHGRYEKFVLLVGIFIKLIMGRRSINKLFSAETMEEQKKSYERYWNNRRTRLIFKLFFNKRMLARKGLNADYFHFDDGSGSFAESFFNRFQKVLRDLPLKGNYFVHLYLKGKYRSINELPAYLEEMNYPVVKDRLDRIHIITEDAKKWLLKMESASIDCFSMSNICELMSEDDTRRTFEEVLRTARPGARVCLRNLMIPREVPEELRQDIVKDLDLSKRMMEHDRSFVYGKNAAYTIEKK